MAHNCKSILIHCMDFRFVSQIRDWMKSQGYLGDCDVVALAGSGKGIADGGQDGEVLLKQVALSRKLHNSCRVVLLHHADCGAYASVYKFADEAEEFAKQSEDMKKIEEIIKKEVPEMEVLKVWARLDDGQEGGVEFKIVE